MASTAAWSAAFSSPRPASSQAAMAAASVDADRLHAPGCGPASVRTHRAASSRCDLLSRILRCGRCGSCAAAATIAGRSRMRRTASRSTASGAAWVVSTIGTPPASSTGFCRKLSIETSGLGQGLGHRGDHARLVADHQADVGAADLAAGVDRRERLRAARPAAGTPAGARRSSRRRCRRRPPRRSARRRRPAPG